MMEILDTILDSGYNLKIYDRFNELSKTRPTYRFPEKYNKFINLPVPHDQVEKIYKESKYSLNMNTVTKSNTMFSRRAFELMLCNTLVISNYSKGMHNLFGDNVIFMSNNKIDLSDSREMRINSLYNVLKNHTYSNRFKQILDTINYDYLPEDKSITIYYIVNNQQEINEIFEHFESINYNSKKLTLILSNQIPNHLIKNLYNKYTNGDIVVYSLNYLKNQHLKISKYLTKLWPDHNGELINPRINFNETPYFIFANLQLEKDFIEKAILHYSYIDISYGIALGDKFKFNVVMDIENVLLSNENFIKALKKILRKDSTKLSVYNIQI